MKELATEKKVEKVSKYRKERPAEYQTLANTELKLRRGFQ